MLKIVFGVFIILHGLVHLLYFGQSRRLFELRPGMVWPDGSWAFSKLLGKGGTRWLASISLVLSAIGFVVGGVGILLGWEWWRPIVAITAVFSSTITILLWDGKIQKLDDQGFVGVIINIFILVALLILL
jgi:hypothetical protein